MRFVDHVGRISPWELRLEGGDFMALLRASDTEVAAFPGIAFIDVPEDGLGPTMCAGFAFDGEPMAFERLKKSLGEPNEFVNLYCRPVAWKAVDQTGLLDSLGLSPDAIEWVRSEEYD
jgi:hypothetical protein